MNNNTFINNTEVHGSTTKTLKKTDIMVFLFVFQNVFEFFHQLM